jgi:microcystin-dependent protein
VSEPFLGEVRMFGGNFAPRGWALCNGQLLSISQNTALFSILGTTFGGDGRVTFGLPNLQGRYAMHWGNGPGLTPRILGETAGSESVTLLTTQMPAHNHTLRAAAEATGDTGRPGNGSLATSATPIYSASNQPDTSMNAGSITPSGGGQPHDNMPPYQCVTFIIALEGIFPSRN